MSGEIAAAIKRYTERKEATPLRNDRIAAEDVYRLVLSGLDLDFQELMELKLPVVKPAVEAVHAGVPRGEVFYGMWVDGLVTGLMIAEARASEAAR